MDKGKALKMNADEFVSLVRKGETKFRVTKIVLLAEGQKIRGQGTLQIVKDDFEIQLEVPRKRNMPSPKRPIWKPADAWKLSGFIDGDLKFSSNLVSPVGISSSWQSGRMPKSIQKLHLERINLAPHGFEALSRAQRDKMLQRPPSPKKTYPDVEFHAVLFDCKPVFLNAGTNTRVKNDFLGICGGGGALDTFIDRGPEYDFALIKKDGDLHVHFRSKAAFRSISDIDDRRRFQALQMGIGFAHGFQPWPYRIEHWRGGKKILDQFKPPFKLTRTFLAPFDDGIGFMGNLRKKGSRNSPIRLAANFFARQSELSNDVSRLLFLFRELGSASFHTKMLGLCSLFEGAVSLMFEGLKLEDELRKVDSKFADYLKLRDRLVSRLHKLATKSNRDAFYRVAGSLSSAKEFRVQDKFKAICNHFGLDYEKDMKKHFEAWNRKRNPYMHGKWIDEDSDFSDQALVAGAINTLVLKLIGYSGRMKFDASAIEPKDRYRII